MGKTDVLSLLYEVIKDRKENPKEGSYTNYLLENGVDKVLKKVGEEATETVIAAKNTSNADLVGEVSDLMYHLSVMLFIRGVSWEDVFAELEKRELKEGNLKTFHIKNEI